MNKCKLALGAVAVLAVVAGFGASETPLAASFVGEAQAKERRGQNCYVTFWPRGRRDIQIQICEDTGAYAKSGTAYLSNSGSQTVNVCVDLKFNGNSPIGWCNSRLKPGDDVGYSCYRCNKKSGGPAIDAIWKKVENR